MKNKDINKNNEKILENNIEQEKEKINDTSFIQNQKIEELKLKLSNNQKKINDIELRKLANIENIKKNTEKKIQSIKDTEIEKFLKKIIPIIDSLEDILILSDKLNIKEEPLIQGIELTLESLFNILYKSDVKIEGKKNELFNSEIHNACSVELSKKIPPNHIISINKKGLIFKNILLRKAQVTISKNC